MKQRLKNAADKWDHPGVIILLGIVLIGVVLVGWNWLMWLAWCWFWPTVWPAGPAIFIHPPLAVFLVGAFILSGIGGMFAGSK